MCEGKLPDPRTNLAFTERPTSETVTVKNFM